MIKEKITSDLIALNLDKLKDTDINVIYIFSPKNNKSFVNCVFEVSSI